MTEETLIKREIKDYLKVYGWFVFHNLAGLGSYAGLSDLTAIKNGLVLFIEVKTAQGKLSKYQAQFKKDIENAGGNYIIARSYEDLKKWVGT